MSVLAFGLFLAMAQVHPGSADAAPAPAFTTQGAFFALSVADIEESVRWYSEKLGMRVVMAPPKNGGTLMRALEGGGLLVELIQDDAAVPLRSAAPRITRDYQVHGLFKSGVVVEDWDRLIATLRERGVPIAIGPFPASPEQRANLIIRDNEGNYIQFFGGYSTPDR